MFYILKDFFSFVFVRLFSCSSRLQLFSAYWSRCHLSAALHIIVIIGYWLPIKVTTTGWSIVFASAANKQPSPSIHFFTWFVDPTLSCDVAPWFVSLMFETKGRLLSRLFALLKIEISSNPKWDFCNTFSLVFYFLNRLYLLSVKGKMSIKIVRIYVIYVHFITLLTFWNRLDSTFGLQCSHEYRTKCIFCFRTKSGFAIRKQFNSKRFVSQESISSNRAQPQNVQSLLLRRRWRDSFVRLFGRSVCVWTFFWILNITKIRCAEKCQNFDVYCVDCTFF